MFCLFISYQISAYLAKPIVELSKKFRLVAQGDLTVSYTCLLYTSLHTQYHFLPYGVECIPQPGYILSSSYDQSQAAEQAE